MHTNEKEASTLSSGNGLPLSRKDDDVELFLKTAEVQLHLVGAKAGQLHLGHIRNQFKVIRNLKSQRTNDIPGYRIEEMCFPISCLLSLTD